MKTDEKRPMKAALLREFNQPLSIEDVETPRPGPDDVLIKMSEALVASETDIPKAVRDLTEGYGADCILDIVGLKSTITSGVDSLRNGGRIVIVGYTPDEYPVSGKRLAQNQLQLIGTRCGRKQDLINTAKVVSGGKVKSIVTDTRPFEEVNDALDLLKSGGVLGRLVLQHEAHP